MLKLELHAHTSDDPTDAVRHTAHDLIDRAAALGYHGVAITLHDRWIGVDPLRPYARDRGIVLLTGIERSIEGRHVLLINFSSKAASVGSFRELAELRRLECGLVVAPHPFYPLPSSLRGMLDQHAELFDAVEVNALYTWWLDFNRAAVRWAKRHDRPLVGNSDVHVLSQMGTTYSLVDAAPEPDAICRAIRAGRVEVRTRPVSSIAAARIFVQMNVAGYRGAREPSDRPSP